MHVQCDMSNDCQAPSSMLDQSGFAYCETHGIQRRNSGRPCRKLRAWEIRKLERGETLARY